MVEVNGAYKHGRYKKIWLRSLSRVKFLPRKTDGQMAIHRPTNNQDIDLYVTHMDQKQKQK